MNGNFFGIFRSVLSRITSPQYTSVRFRYHAEKIAKGPLVKDYGYKEKLLLDGLLPRDKNAPLYRKLPEYKPKNSWSKRRALHGQNDYIDLFTNNKIHPVDTHYDVPSWIRGVYTRQEYGLLLRKISTLGTTDRPIKQPMKWIKLKKRMEYLHYFLNYKQRSDLLHPIKDPKC